MRLVRHAVALSLAMLVSASLFSTATGAEPERAVIASPSAAPTIGMDAMAQNLPYLAEFIDDYFPSRCGARPELTTVEDALHRSGPKIILCSADTASRLKNITIPNVEIDHDGFYLLSRLDKQGVPAVYCVGHRAGGIKYALYRLIHECDYRGRTLSLPGPLRLAVNPFLENRVHIQSLSWKIGDAEANAKFFWNHWSDDRVDAMVRMHDFFGFNGVQRDLLSFPDKVAGDAAEETTERLSLRVLDEERRIGGRATAFCLGAGMWDGNALKTRMCLTTEPTRGRMLQEYRHMAQSLGPHVDAFVSHWADPGGCDGEHCQCTVRTPQQSHMELLQMMRQYNPKIESHFSVWYLASTAGVPPQRRSYWRWSNTKGIDDVLNSGILSDDVGVWVGNPCGFDPGFCRAVNAKGRVLGIWAWYLADNEIRPCLHVHWRQVAGYFRDLASQDYAGRIRWHTLEANRHGDWNTLALAVGGAAMIDPLADPKPYAREFCASLVGDDNADAMLEILDAVGQTRCRHHRSLQGRRFHDHEGWGSDDPKADAALAQHAIDKLDRIRLAEDHIPKIPYVEIVFQTSEMLADLRKHLQNIIRHNQARARLLEAIATPEFAALSNERQQARIRELGRKFMPEFDTKGIGSCPEATLWTGLIGRSGLLPDMSKRVESEGS